PFPFAKTSLEAECARFVVAEPRCDLTALAAFGVVCVSILPTGDDDVRGQGIVLPPHFLDRCVHFAHIGIAGCRERVLQAIGAHLFTSSPRTIATRPRGAKRRIADRRDSALIRTSNSG